MKNIISPRNKQKKNKIRQFAVGGVLIFIMFFSVLGYAFGGRENEDIEKINYNGFEFVNQNSLWFLDLGGLNFVFKHNPKEVEKIYSLLNPVNNYQGLPLYISSESDEAQLEISRNLNQIVQRMQPACLKKYECEGNWPVKNCTDNFIIIKKDDISKITQEDNCVFISGPQENLTMIADEFLFKILGVEQ
jgi:hypothetical protein